MSLDFEVMAEVTGELFLDHRHILKIKECHVNSFCSCLCTQYGIEKKEPCLSYRLCPACSVGKTKVESQQILVNNLCCFNCKLPVTIYRSSQIRLYRIYF